MIRERGASGCVVAVRGIIWKEDAVRRQSARSRPFLILPTAPRRESILRAHCNGLSLTSDDPHGMEKIILALTQL